MSKAAETIAKCEKCGRGFVWLNPDSDHIDHYYPANKPFKRTDPPTNEECGGRIVLISAPASL